jgi:hypothetical protein
LNKYGGYFGGLIKKKSVWVIIYTIYITMIILSINAHIAENTVEDLMGNMNAKYNYSLEFLHDGESSHYDVTRHNANEPGKISLTYYTSSNQLNVYQISNIKSLKIDVNSMFKDESIRVFKRPSESIENWDLDYWLNAGDGIFTVTFDVIKSEPLESLTFSKFPEPTSVLVNNQEWWNSNLNYSINENGISITNIPTGKTTVIFNFNIPNKLPVPLFTMNPDTRAGVGQEIVLNANSSYDPDGEIKHWLWEMGEGICDSGCNVNYNFSSPGEYIIKLTVRDDAEPYGEASLEKNILIEYGAEQDNDNNGKGDGLPDWWEWKYFEDFKYGPKDDSDNDGYDNGLELMVGTDPNNKSDFSEDSDSDVLPDFWEWKYFESILSGPDDDPDGDEATNSEELKAYTNPMDENSKPIDNKEEKDETHSGELDLLNNVNFIILTIIIIIIVILSIFIPRRKNRRKIKPPPQFNKTKPIVLGYEQYRYQQRTANPVYSTNLNTFPSQTTQLFQNSFQQSIKHKQSRPLSIKGPPKRSKTPQTGYRKSTSKPVIPKRTPPEPIISKQVAISVADKVPTPSKPEVQRPITKSIAENITIPPKPDIDIPLVSPIADKAPTSSERKKTRPLAIPMAVKVPIPSKSKKSKPAAIPVLEKESIEDVQSNRENVIMRYVANLGLNHDKAALLYDNGYTKLDILKSATINELADIDGIEHNDAEYIKEELEKIDQIKKLSQNKASKQKNALTNEIGKNLISKELLDRVMNTKKRLSDLEHR